MNTNITPEQKLKRAIWLAFQASPPMGMGFLHTASANAQTEESLTEGVTDKAYFDYAHGRMMKTEFSLKDGRVCIHPETPRSDYQSWGNTYSSAAALLDAVEKSFNP